jgi:hypothetical protein
VYFSMSVWLAACVCMYMDLSLCVYV